MGSKAIQGSQSGRSITHELFMMDVFTVQTAVTTSQFPDNPRFRQSLHTRELGQISLDEALATGTYAQGIEPSYHATHPSRCALLPTGGLYVCLADGTFICNAKVV
ncbi:uncharacterized protein MYCFIDRAFT_178933 [Pseudocercospora fijiensis CIRAD86]|uniref:Uncharacterized protein n=1 Tax=Pseudocercospora fijiensis (strain CIRAD86) TaxID=383855 RepID=M3AN19_PSEFD|nr:uncharacterized protein MYCFIDRAFT_178933 [Pseudocercospora fijiensis CIRAD86]EME78842.1 hypothetical protein MYCFIDRAFT_178933 [Pseudocercospora fijiensis CIRAD86]